MSTPLTTPNAFARNFKDADLKASIALPSAAGSAVTAGIDTGARTTRAVMPDVEFEVKVPAIAVGIAPNTVPLTLIIETDEDAAFGSPTTIFSKTLTASGGVGIPAQNWRNKAPQFMERYVRAKFTTANVGSGEGEVDFGNASALIAEFAILATQINC